MQVRCKEKKRIGGGGGTGSSCSSAFLITSARVLAEKKSGETSKEKKMNGTMDENSNTSIVSVENSEQVKEEISPKRNAKRTAKGKPVKYGSDDDDDENQENFDDNESDYLGSDSETEKVVKKSKPKAKAQVNPNDPCVNSRAHSVYFSHPRRRRMRSAC